MPHLIEVSFKGNRKEFFRWEGDEPPTLRAAVIVEADRGEDLGRVHALGDLAAKRCTGCSHGCGAAQPEKRLLRVASLDDERRAAELRAQDEDARRRAMERVKAHGLVMKLSDAEWQWDRRKLTFYFTAEKRVDFRALVRDLAAAFRTRIELKQIGVRDEAKRLDGVGRCGRQYCSAGWLPDLRPVNLQVAKDQGLSLNPSQISGACGRLMCCLRYEHDFYIQSRKRFPKEGRLVRTRYGEEKVVANDIFNERVTLRGAEGDVRVVLLSALKEELDAVAGPPGAGGADQPADAAEDSSAGMAKPADLDEEAVLEDVGEPLFTPVAPVRVQGAGAHGAQPGSGAPTAKREPREVRARNPVPAAQPPDATPSPQGAPAYPGARRRGRRGGRRGKQGDGPGSPNEG